MGTASGFAFPVFTAREPYEYLCACGHRGCHPFLLTVIAHDEPDDFFGWAALPGIVLAVFIRKYPQVGLVETLPIVAHFLIAIVLSWGVSCLYTPA